MMNNLFESFDPSTSIYLSLNWLNLFYIINFIPLLMWIMPNRLTFILMSINNKIFYEFKNLIKSKYKINIIIFFNLFIIIIIMNLFSLFPYIFTLTSHISLNLILSIPLWISFIIIMMIKFPTNLLAHFVPLNTPSFLMNFMVLIELISNLIRPWTLSIRLMANLIAGHLLLTLIGTFMSNFLKFFFISILIQNMLYILEISVAMIQAYVFSILMILYFSETKN